MRDYELMPTEEDVMLDKKHQKEMENFTSEAEAKFREGCRALLECCYSRKKMHDILEEERKKWPYVTGDDDIEIFNIDPVGDDRIIIYRQSNGGAKAIDKEELYATLLDTDTLSKNEGLEAYFRIKIV